MTRENSIKIRNNETHAIKELVIYASNQGSENADKLYMVYTKLVNRELSIKNKSRDELSILELEYVKSCELLISKLLIDLMA